MLFAFLLWWCWSKPAPRLAPAASPAGRSGVPAQEDFAVFTPEQLRAELASGEWLVHWLAGAPQVLVIEFPDLQSQGRALNRAAALIEKRGGARDRVLSDAELQALIQASGDTTASYFLGHDYRAGDLARFYTLAAAQGVVLDAQELRLRQLLERARLLAPGAAGVYAGTDSGALVTFSAADAGAGRPDEHVDLLRRASILEHELSHGRFFTDGAYREHCGFFWHQLLSETERETWRRYLSGRGYDPGNEELMINETQALLMHTPDVRDFSAAALHWNDAELEALRERFRLGLVR